MLRAVGRGRGGCGACGRPGLARSATLGRANDNDRYVLAAQPGKSQGRPKKSSPRSKRIVQTGLPDCVLPRKPLSRSTDRTVRARQQPSENDLHAPTSERPVDRQLAIAMRRPPAARTRAAAAPAIRRFRALSQCATSRRLWSGAPRGLLGPPVVSINLVDGRSGLHVRGFRLAAHPTMTSVASSSMFTESTR